jgi:UDP-GlcNAc:undecaprenyl-phosphate GlcNAc-1-phosphate transferase
VSALIGAIAGCGAAFGLWVGLQDLLGAPSLRRLNVRGRVVPVGGGILLVLAVLVVAAFDRFFASFRDTSAVIVPGSVLFAVLGFGLLGLLDDLLESGDVKGFRGHVSSLARGRLTTGAVKLVGGGLVALIVAPHRLHDRAGWLLVDAALIALAANLANLLDRAPGRVTKVSLVVGGAVVATHLAAADVVLGGSEVVGLAVVLGAAAGLLVPDLREQVMLGDAGANVLGAAIGLAVVAHVGPAGRLVALGVVLVLNALSEKVSFSRVISGTPGLRHLDRLGRLPADDD